MSNVIPFRRGLLSRVRRQFNKLRGTPPTHVPAIFISADGLERRDWVPYPPPQYFIRPIPEPMRLWVSSSGASQYPALNRRREYELTNAEHIYNGLAEICFIYRERVL